MNRRNFLKTGTAGILVAAAPAIVDSKGLFRGACGIVKPGYMDMGGGQFVWKGEKPEIFQWDDSHEVREEFNVIKGEAFSYESAVRLKEEMQHRAIPPTQYVYATPNPVTMSRFYEEFMESTGGAVYL